MKYVPMTHEEKMAIDRRNCLLSHSQTAVVDATEQAVLARIEQQGLVIVPVADCPNCTNDGAYYDNYGQVHQCQWCYEMPHSRFNQKQAMLEAAKEAK
jgi:DICT domain-containing protein